MSSLNKVILIGNLGRDPEVKYIPDGTAVTAINLATNERWKGKDGTPHEQTEWHRVVLWGKLAEVAGQYLNKGSQACIEGKLQTRKYTDKQGIERYTTEIRADRLVMLGSAGGARRPEPDHPAAQQTGQPTGQPAERPAARPSNTAQDYREASRGDPRRQSYEEGPQNFPGMDDDIPF